MNSQHFVEQTLKCHCHGSMSTADTHLLNSLVDECVKTKKLSEADSNLLKLKRQKITDLLVLLTEREQALVKKSKSLTNEVLAEKISVEKLRIEDAEEVQALRKLESTRAAVSKEYEFTEQRDTMAKFELSEMKKTHEELVQSIFDMRKENGSAVGPVLERLKHDILEMADQLGRAEEVFERETAHKKNITSSFEELEGLKQQKGAAIALKSESLALSQSEPSRLLKWAETIEKASTGIDIDLGKLAQKIKSCDFEIEKEADRRSEAEKLRIGLLEKLDLNRHTIEKREVDVAVVRKNLENAKSQHHDLITSKVELNLQRRENESALRYRSDQSALAHKGYEVLKRQIKKRATAANGVKQVLVPLASQLFDQELILKTYENDLEEKKCSITTVRADVTFNMMQFMQMDGVEKEKRIALSQSALEVEEVEADVQQMLAEVKRQGQLRSVLAAQRDIKGRDLTVVERKDKEARSHVRIKELVILDLTKRCNEISNRLKEFSALYEVVKNERNKYVNLIQSSTQGLSEMREKIRILLSEVEILGNESTAKDLALTKEINAHQQAQAQRDSLRQDMNGLLSEYRLKQSTVEQQIQEIDKLNVVINTLEKEMLELKGNYERAIEDRNVTGVQLIDRNDELCILYERSNQQQQALKAGELLLLKKTDELRLLRLQTEELKRQYAAARRHLPEVEFNKNKIEVLDAQLVAERRKTDTCSTLLEDPNNLERWRPLEGEDPTFEQLSVKIKVLEGRIDGKREQLLEKELVLEEVTSLTNRLRNQAVSKRDSAKILVDKLNDYQSKIRETTKKMLASVSELSMYQATALRLQQEKGERQSALEAAHWRSDHGEAPTEDSAKDFEASERLRALRSEALVQRAEDKQAFLTDPASMMKTACEPRPSAYIPDDIGIPKPYGSHAPFKPSEAGSTIRHIRLPQPKQIEI